jgi:CheY-like chemotaxis protein
MPRGNMMERSRILIIDDEKDFLDSLKLGFESEGYEIVTAQDGEEGLAKAKDIRPDLIICDIRMPKKDGFMVLKEIRQDVILRRIPFIMLTVIDDFERLKDAYQDEADFYVTKPVELFILTKNVRTLLNLSRSRLS